MKRIVLFLMCAASAPALAQSSLLVPQSDVPHALTEAHEAYLRRDWPALVAGVKSTLRDPQADDAVRANAMDLWRAATKDRCSSLPADWRLPVGLRWLNVSEVFQTRPSGERYSL